MPVPDFSPGEIWTAGAADSIGLWRVTTASVSAQPTLTVDNCFSANYQFYRVLVSMNGVTNNNQLQMRLLDSSGNPLVTNYQAGAYGQDFTAANTAFTGTLAASTLYPLCWLPNSSSHGPAAVQMDIQNPFESSIRTGLNGLHTSVASGTSFFAGAFFGFRVNAERARGLLFLNNSGTNMTGTVRVYGYRD
jgi:hypothetical protein